MKVSKGIIKVIKSYIVCLKPKGCLLIIIGSFILNFGIYNIHSVSGVTEGGVIGLTLLGYHHFGISPAITSFIISGICYVIGWKTLEKTFLGYSVLATASGSIIYAILECFPRVIPKMEGNPLLASILGAIFVGVGAGICVYVGGATSGDDALAMSLSRLLKTDIRWIYLISDVSVLALSITYIPIGRILYSLLSVIISGQIIGWIPKIVKSNKKSKE